MDSCLIFGDDHPVTKLGCYCDIETILLIADLKRV